MSRKFRGPNRTETRESFASDLEKRARRTISNSRNHTPSSSVNIIIEEEMALLLDQIDRLESRRRELLDDMLQAESHIDTELIQMEDRTPRYSPYRFPERENIQRRLTRLNEERRRLTTIFADKLDSFHDRLLSLLKKHRQLQPWHNKKGRFG